MVLTFQQRRAVGELIARHVALAQNAIDRLVGVAGSGDDVATDEQLLAIVQATQVDRARPGPHVVAAVEVVRASIDERLAADKAKRAADEQQAAAGLGPVAPTLEERLADLLASGAPLEVAAAPAVELTPAVLPTFVGDGVAGE